MTQTSSNVALHGTRLVRFITDLAITDSAFSHNKLAERLSRLIDFSDSVKLSEFHEGLAKVPFESVPASTETLREQVIRVRMSLVQSVVTSLIPDAKSARIKMTSRNAGLPIHKLATFDPYHDLYASHQREFDYKIQSLQVRVRDAVSGVSPELAKLAALDKAMRDTFSPHTREYFAVIPRLLGKRFALLLEEHESLQDDSNPHSDEYQADLEILRKWTQPNGWLGRFLNEMQEFLLAELELRLLPVLGLIEAVSEQEAKH